MSTAAAGSKAFIVTGPTSCIGRATVLELSKHGTIVLVGRDAMRLEEVQRAIVRRGRHAVAHRTAELAQDLAHSISVVVKSSRHI